MKRFNSYMMVIGVLAASFAGGAASRWILPATPQAHAAPKTRGVEDALRWSLSKPVYTRKLNVGDPKGGVTGLIDPTGMKLYGSNKKARIRLESGSGLLALADSGGKDRVKLGTVQGGDTGIALFDSSGRRRIQIDSGGLKIYSASDKLVGNFGFQSDGSMGASVADKTGKLKRIDLEPEADKKP
jgi:hypothetical protein